MNLGIKLLNSLLLAQFALLINFSAFGNDDCPSHIRGDTIHWVVAVCEQRSETDDFESPAVQDCLADTIAKDNLDEIGKHNCKLNARYKREWCSVSGDATDEASAKCFVSPTLLPRVVVEGGVGG
jgi:hypothetical protein